MTKQKPGNVAAKNSYGNVTVPMVDKSMLGTIRHCIEVFRGEKGEAGGWFAKFRGLPGYLGGGFTEADAIADLWTMVGNGPVYDVSKSRGLDPTPANIRNLLGRARRISDPVREISQREHVTDEEVAAIAKGHGMSRNSLKPAVARAAKWKVLGGIGKAVSELGYGHRCTALEIGRDQQAWFENNPERARMLLARQKFPVR